MRSLMGSLLKSKLTAHWERIRTASGLLNRFNSDCGTAASFASGRPVFLIPMEDKRMKYYHGTIAEYAKGILAEGLNPIQEQAFHIGRIPVPKNRVYLTTDLGIATMYSEARSRYEMAKPGEDVELGFMDWRMKGLDTVYHNGIDTTPVVLQVDLPNDGRYKLESDPDSSLLGLEYRCECHIPPELIKIT